MSRIDYLKEKSIYITSNLAVAALTVAMLFILMPTGGRQFSLLVGILYLSGAFIPLELEYAKKKRFYDAFVRTFENLERKNLIAEMISYPDFFEGAFLHDVIKRSNKACMEEINRYKNMQEEYREYIELWVHEIKTPIASSKLIAQNNKNEVTNSMSEEIDAIENYVEQALYYARSSTVEKDYIIKEIDLKTTVFAALKRDSRLLIRGNVSVTAQDLDVSVYSDSKWLEFILHQLIVNAVKYSGEGEAQLIISARQKENCGILTVSDNGIGIPENELSRIFDKGFTGTNGRLKGRSTGMGLYICRKLCEKLGSSISAESKPGIGTEITIIFPKSSMTDII
jgi:signal transduction histidine kinase